MAFVDLLAAICLFVNGVKGMSAVQLSRDLDVQYKTAFVLATSCAKPCRLKPPTKRLTAKSRSTAHTSAVTFARRTARKIVPTAA